ncbi:MAG TPA: PfkB family carbohydrate kinase [Acetobacteraceae bacterium]|nr:PfkB family carbohydrate kinase [Acetobacteraceae bacterium]
MRTLDSRQRFGVSRVLVFGAINVDFVFLVPRLPGRGDTIWGERGWISAGGKGAIQAVAAARDGARVSLAGAVGRDGFADAVLAELSEEGIELGGVGRRPVPTGRSAICVEHDGHTGIVTDRGANAFALADQVSDDALMRGRTLLVQMDTDPVEVGMLILRARRLGVRVILNLSPSRLIDADAVRAADVLIGNNEEIAWLGERLGTANNAASIHAAIGITTVRMMGVQGVEAMTDRGWLQMPAMPVEMQDTTAAADCFVGVIAAALGRRTPFPDALRRAAVAAALSAREVGAKSSLPRRPEIDAALCDAPPTSRQEEVPD